MNLEFLSEFYEDVGLDPILHKDRQITIIKLFKKERVSEIIDAESKEVKFTYKTVMRDKNPKFLILPNNGDINLEHYIKLKTLSLSTSLQRFLKLQKNENEVIKLEAKTHKGYFIENEVFKIKLYNNYLENLNNKKKISDKIQLIINDKYSVGSKIRSANTNYILSNIGSLIKNNEGKYLELSKGDKSFIKQFIFDQVHNKYFDFKLIEAFPMFKEDIENIITIGEELINTPDTEFSSLQFSKKHLGHECKTLESCWQKYFEKYLRIFFMGYKHFYSQRTFKAAPGYDKETRPDFLGVDFYNNIDIIEIKHHRTPLLSFESGRDSYYPSNELNKSVFQLNKYLDLQSDLINISKIDDKYIKSIIADNKIYRPRGILIISSEKYMVKNEMDDETHKRIEKEIKKLKTTYHNIDIVLFDELIESLKNYLKFMQITFTENQNNGEDDGNI